MRASELSRTLRATLCSAAVLATGPLLAACATHEYPQEHTYKYYRGPARPPTELATLALGDATAVRIDGRQVTRSDYTHVELLPGTYSLEWTGYGGSVTVEFKPAYRYSLRCSGTTEQMFQWVSDDTEGRLVRGTVRGTRRP